MSTRAEFSRNAATGKDQVRVAKIFLGMDAGYDAAVRNYTCQLELLNGIVKTYVGMRVTSR